MVKVNKDVIDSWWPYYGMPGIDGLNAGNEPAHNAYSKNAKEFGIYNTESEIFVGNDGSGISWDDFIDYWVYKRRPTGVRPNDSGFWGIGGTKLFPMKFGLIDYVLTILNGKYFKYTYNWEGIDINSKNPYSSHGLIQNLNMIKEELTQEQYQSYVPQYFSSTPNILFRIVKWTDCDTNFSPNIVRKNLSMAFSATRNKMKSWVMDSSLSKPIENFQTAFPTIHNGIVPETPFQLNKIHSDMQIQGGVFDVYHYKYEHESFSSVKWDMINKYIDGNTDKIFCKPRHKPSTAMNHFFDSNGIYLLSIPQGTGSKGMLKGTEYNYSNMVFVLKSGSFKFSTVKGADLDEKLDIETSQIHKDYLDSDTTLQHTGKGEDSKVIQTFNQIFENGIYRSNIISSLQYFTDETLKIADIKQKLNHKHFKPIGKYALREHDWVIKTSESNDWLLHLEFMNGTEDWLHIDKLNFSIDTDGIPYQVLVVDSISNSKEKINDFKVALEQKQPKHLKKLWVVELQHLLNFNDMEFENGLIYDNKI